MSITTKIRRQKFHPRLAVPPFNVTQGQRNQDGSLGYLPTSCH